MSTNDAPVSVREVSPGRWTVFLATEYKGEQPMPYHGESVTREQAEAGAALAREQFDSWVAIITPVC